MPPIDFQQLFEQSSAAVLVLAPERAFPIVAVTDAYLRATRQTREALVGKGLFEAFPDKPLESHASGTRNLRASLERALATRAPDAMPVQRYDIPRPEGGFEERYWSPVNTPLLGPDGQVRYLLHQVEDVTPVIGLSAQGDMSRAELRALRLAEEARAALRQSEERLRLATQASRVGIWELELSTMTAWRNALHDRAFGYEVQLPHWSFDVFLSHVHPEDRERVRVDMQRAMQEQGAFEQEFRVRWPDGTWHWMAASGRVERDQEGRPARMVGTNADITDRKLREEAERQRAEVERQLIGIVSHDLRNPLHTILLGIRALLRKSGYDERTLKALLRIQSGAERASRLVEDLLDFTQARLGGGIPVKPRATDLHAVTWQAVEDIQMAYAERTVQLRQEGDVRGVWDPDRLAQVVMNLVTNALKYSPPNTGVTVTTRMEEGAAVLEVHNAGDPIPLEQLGLLFEPMQRGSSQADPAGRSVGLGLYIVEHLVRAHGGTLGVTSTAEEGTTFIVRLPRDTSAQ